MRIGAGVYLSQLIAAALLLVGCPQTPAPSNERVKQQDFQDADAAVDYYLKATKDDPHNVSYRLKLGQARFEACQRHIQQGLKRRADGDLRAAISEFQRAQVLDPASSIAEQELKKTIDLLTEQLRAVQTEPAQAENTQFAYASEPPELKPLSRAPINLKMSNDAKVVFDTLGKLGGLTVIYDPDLQARRISTELKNVSLEQALDIVCLESKAFWKPLTENIVLIVPDQTQKRRDYEEQEVRTFYLNNIAFAQDLTEVSTGLRQLLDLKRIQQINAQNAVIIRDTPDKLALVEKIIQDMDKAKPEVMIQMEVLQARTDKLRDLGIQPWQNVSVAINPNYSSSSDSSKSNGKASLAQLTHLNQNDVVLTLPSVTANFLLTDSATKIIDNPEIRAVDGQPAKLRVGDRVPVATGSFQSGTGVGSSGVNPLVNTQFQYIDVGVSLDVTPHVHVNREISLKVLVEVSSVTGYATIGGIQQPIISQRKVEHEIRLKEGEVSILGGLFERVDSKTLNGWPGLANVPLMRYLFSSENVERQENENLIVLIPRIVRMPDWSLTNLRAMYAGSETYPSVKKVVDLQSPSANPDPQPVSPDVGPVSSLGSPRTPQLQVNGPRIRFEPPSMKLKLGETAAIGVVVENITDLFAIPLLLEYDPAVVSIEKVDQADFFWSGSQGIALVQRIDKERGQALVYLSRPPNTAGVNGTGKLLSVVVRAIGAGSSKLSIVQMNPRDSREKQIAVQAEQASLDVKQ
jgi:general secretion pathway protein D